MIPAGAEPVKLRIPGKEHLVRHDATVTTSNRVGGGGYIAAEFSHIAARAGAHVTIVQLNERLLPRFDRDLVGWLMHAFDALAIDARTGTTVEAIEKMKSSFIVHARSYGRQENFVTDLVVHSAGRAPRSESSILRQPMSGSRCLASS